MQEYVGSVLWFLDRGSASCHRIILQWKVEFGKSKIEHYTMSLGFGCYDNNSCYDNSTRIFLLDFKSHKERAQVA